MPWEYLIYIFWYQQPLTSMSSVRAGSPPFCFMVISWRDNLYFMTTLIFCDEDLELMLSETIKSPHVYCTETVLYSQLTSIKECYLMLKKSSWSFLLARLFFINVQRITKAGWMVKITIIYAWNFNYHYFSHILFIK